MNSGDAEKQRVVVPQWLPFGVASMSRELLAPTAAALIDTSEAEQAFAEALSVFNAAPTPFLGADLFGVSLRLGNKEATQKLGEYLLATPIVGPVVLKTVRQALGLDRPPLRLNVQQQARVRESKAWLRRFPADAIAWVEQARLYTLIGQKRRAESSINRALSFAPTDRYVVRCAVRFFIHRNDWERANEVAGHAARVTNDPWLSALWVSTGSQLGVLPNKFKTLCAQAAHATGTFHFSELLEACATQEVIDGADKRAKRMFRRAWTDPAKAVITHSQWVLRERLPELARSATLDFSQSAEAMAWVSLMRMDFGAANQSAREWALEEPFSSNAFMHGSFVSTLRERYQEAEMFAKEGLQANPGHEGLTNNLAFALANQNRVAEAAALLEPMQKEIAGTRDVALVATFGLIRMKQGAHAEGRELYLKAMRKAGEEGDSRLAIRALLNLFIAELDSGGALDPELMDTAADALGKSVDARIIATAEAVQRRLRAKQSLFPSEKETAAAAKFEKALNGSSKELKKLVSTTGSNASQGDE